MRKLVTVLGLLLTGCTSLKTEMQNSPMAELTGPTLFVDVTTPDYRPISSPWADIVRDQAYRYLDGKGFSKAKSRVDAHTVVIFVPGTRDRDVYVPAQTYAVPIYQPGQTTTYNFYNNSGGSVYGTAQSSGTTQWQTGFREGYSTRVQDQWLMVQGYAQVNGEPPSQMFGGQVYRTRTNFEFLADESALRNGVNDVLRASMLSGISRVPAASAPGRPGCRPMVGFEIDRQKMDNEKVAVVKRIMPNSAAEAAGLMAGDEIKSMAGYDYAEFSSDSSRASNLYKTGNVKVVAIRKGKDKEFQIRPKEVCPD